MILIGQFDSPFVRRVAIAMELYRFDYEHRPWSTFSDAGRIAAYNPLCRVPTLILEDGSVLIESGAILDYLDELAGAFALIPDRGPLRRDVLKVCALATGLGDKAVGLVYERALHPQVSNAWIDRCQGQIDRVLAALESDRRTRPTPFWFGDAVGHADVAVACVLRFLREAHPALFDTGRWPALTLHAEGCEQLQPFRAVVQAFVPPS